MNYSKAKKNSIKNLYFLNFWFLFIFFLCIFRFSKFNIFFKILKLCWINNQILLFDNICLKSTVNLFSTFASKIDNKGVDSCQRRSATTADKTLQMSVAAIQKRQHSPSHSSAFERGSCAIASSLSFTTLPSSNADSNVIFSTPSIDSHFNNSTSNNFNQILTSKLANLPDTIPNFTAYNGGGLNSISLTNNVNLFPHGVNLTQGNIF